MDYENLADTRRIQEYVTNMRPAFNKRAVFSDETENYRTPAEPEPGDVVNIRIRTKSNNVDFVYLVAGNLRQRMKLLGTKDGLIITGQILNWERSPSAIFLKLFPEKFNAITIKWVLQKRLTSIIPLE